MNIEQALARSRSHTEIVHCTATQDEIDGLCAEAEGSTDLVSQYGYVDVWGTDDDGVEYRLHIAPEPVTTSETLSPDQVDELLAERDIDARAFWEHVGGGDRVPVIRTEIEALISEVSQ